MSQKKPSFPFDLKTILIALAAVVVLYLVFSGKLPLGGSGLTDPAPGSELSAQGDIPIVTADPAAQAATASSTTAPATREATTQAPSTAPATREATTQAPSTAPTTREAVTHVAKRDYYFRNKSLLNSHYEKHGIEMGFAGAKEYEAAASAVINNPLALYKTEKEDGDHIFYLEKTNEFVVLSLDGYIRTYFKPSGGKAYFNRQ